MNVKMAYLNFNGMSLTDYYLSKNKQKNASFSASFSMLKVFSLI